MLVGRQCSIWNCPIFRGHSFIFRGGNCWKHPVHWTLENSCWKKAHLPHLSSDNCSFRTPCASWRRTDPRFAAVQRDALTETTLGESWVRTKTKELLQVRGTNLGFWGEVFQSLEPKKNRSSDLISRYSLPQSLPIFVRFFPIPTSFLQWS